MGNEPKMPSGARMSVQAGTAPAARTLRTVTLPDDLVGRLVSRLRSTVDELDADLSTMPAGAPRRAAKQAAYDQAHADYLALVTASLAGSRS